MSGNKWIRNYTVSEANWPEMEVTSYIYPRGSPEAGTRLTVRKSVIHFQRLSRELESLFRDKVSASEAFPSLPNQPDCHHCQKLLNFASQYPPLYNSQVFVKFCQSSTPSSPEEEPQTGGEKAPDEEDVPDYLATAAEDISKVTNYKYILCCTRLRDFGSIN